jgi:hypothetical protein
MEPSINEVSKWLHMHKGHAIKISKEEDGDIDQVELQLNDVTVGHTEGIDPDGYVAPQAILLHGHGIIKSGNQQAQLPLNAFEIPLEGQCMTTPSGEGLQMKTSRAVYTFQL